MQLRNFGDRLPADSARRQLNPSALMLWSRRARGDAAVTQSVVTCL
jgi:hypothetical protein